ncbi:hypothetical protein TNCV_2295051 [Trichonephila clavipes]|nr:hypothetical protein TNCV_2295051 [Trichonephila clavipes]
MSTGMRLQIVYHKDSTHGDSPTFSEIATRVKQHVSSSWRQAPIYEWYEGYRPVAALNGTINRRDETILARLRRGHTRAQRRVTRLKVHPLCSNCNVTQAAPTHIFAFISSHKNRCS